MKKTTTLLSMLLLLACITISHSLNAQVLYDNGPYYNSVGTGAAGANESVLYTTTFGMGTIGFGHQSNLFNRVADDFQVTDCMWRIDSIVFFSYQTGSTTTSTMTGVNFRIWDSVPDAVGSSVVFGDTTTNRMTRTVWSGAYRITETTTGNSTRPIMRNVCALNNVYVSAGTFWLDWASTGSLASGPWAPPRTPVGQSITGNGKQRIGSTWNNLVDGGTGTPAQGLPFIIYGTALNASADAGQDMTFCLGSMVTIGGAPTGTGNGPLTYMWMPGDSLSSVSVANPTAWPSASTSYEIMVTDSIGCVARDTVMLTVNMPSVGTISAAACVSYTTPSGNVLTVSGIYTDTIMNAAGCDSVITINLNLNQPSSSTLNIIACQSYVSPEGNTYTVSGVYNDTILNTTGCDSLITINLTIGSPDAVTISPVACDSYTSPAGNIHTLSGTYEDTLTNMYGCDSVITIQLTVLNASMSTLNPVVCGTYTSPSGAVYNSTGTYMDTLTNMAGCDSVITINLVVNSSTASTLSVTSCGGYMSPSGNWWVTSGTYSDTITNASGCDSVITIQLTVINLMMGLNLTGFQITSVQSGATYQWVDCVNNYTPIAGATGQSFTPSVDGSYAVIVTLNSCTDTSGCQVIIGIGMNELIADDVMVYPNPANDVVTINFGSEQIGIVITIADMNGRIVKSESINAAHSVNVNLDVAAGMYIMTVQTESGVVMKQLIKE
jgi:hypothetical protein